VESQQCTDASLRALDKYKKKVTRTPEDETPPEWTGAQPVNGNRVCVRVEGFEVKEGALNFSFQLDSVPTEPGTVDCREKCPVDQILAFAGPTAQVRDKWFHPPGATTIALYRDEDACREADLVEPSGVPPDLCATLGPALGR
jgi:hypothetical protein